MKSPSFELFFSSLCAAVVLISLAPSVSAYDVPSFEKAPFDRDGIFLEDGERQSLLEALAAISSNFKGTSSIDEDVVEKALAVALAIDPFHGNSRKAHEALAMGEQPSPTSFYDSRSAAAEALWGIASNLSSPPVEPEAGRLAPLVMEIALLVHPSTESERILKFASLSEGIDEAWAGFVDLQPGRHDSNLRARGFRREAKDMSKGAKAANKPSRIFMVEPGLKPPPPSKEKNKPTPPPPPQIEAPPVVGEERSIAGVFPTGDQYAAGRFSFQVRAPRDSEEAGRFPFLLERLVEAYPFLPIVGAKEAAIPLVFGQIPTEKAKELGILWQQGALGELEFVPSDGAVSPPSDSVRSSLALVLCLQSISQSRPLNPNFGVVGTYNRSAHLIEGVSEPADSIEAGEDLGIRYLLLPEQSSSRLISSLIRSEDLKLLFHSELLSVDSLEAAFDILTLAEIPEAFETAGEIFAEIEMVSTRMDLPDLARNEKVQERLEEILTLVPNHLSARAMLEFGRAPVDEEAPIREAIRAIDDVIEPYFSLRRELRADDAALLAQMEVADETLFLLRTTIPAEARDYHDLATDMLESAEAYLNFSNKETSLAQQRLEQTQSLLDELNDIKIELGMPIRRKPPRF
ncbi:MAG: hypothetical protein AAF491_04660 [Verrucomicrobiota bacterium]